MTSRTCAECERFFADTPDGGLYDRAQWHVHISEVSGKVHVEPVQGMLCLMGVGSYCRTDWGVRRAIKKWQRWCDKKNAKQTKAQAMAAKAEALLS